MTSRRLTCHVLDSAHGHPAAGMGIRLDRLTLDDVRTLVEVVTNDDGRTDAPLLEGTDMLDATYELTFQVGAYFAAGATGNAPLFNEVPVRFTVSSDVRRLHLALLVTPWSYTAYRGS